MKKLIGLLGALLVLTTTVFAADPACGIWKSIDDETGEVTAIWKIYEKDGMLFGTIAATTNDPQDVIADACKESYKNFPVSGAVNKMKTVGTPWIFNMKKVSEGYWKDGNIVNPSDGKMWGCVIKFMKAGSDKKAKTDTLAMAGTVGPLKKFQYWIPGTEADIAEAQKKNPAKN